MKTMHAEKRTHAATNGRLALGELRCAAGALQSRLLAFLDARVATQESGALQVAACVGVQKEERAADAVAHRVALGCAAATLYDGIHIAGLQLVDQRQRR